MKILSNVTDLILGTIVTRPQLSRRRFEFSSVAVNFGWRKNNLNLNNLNPDCLQADKSTEYSTHPFSLQGLTSDLANRASRYLAGQR